MPPARFQGMIVWLITLLVALWFLYWAYKIAQHVGAWPFGSTVVVI